MEPTATAPDRAFWDELHRRRAELRDSMGALEQALAAPAPDRLNAWAERVHVALVELSGDLKAHVDITEGRNGLYQAILRTAPRLSASVNRLTKEHADITAAVDTLMGHVSVPGVTHVDRVRELATDLFAILAHHRQRGSDLLYDAYDTDIGGET